MGDREGTPVLLAARTKACFFLLRTDNVNGDDERD